MGFFDFYGASACRVRPKRSGPEDSKLYVHRCWRCSAKRHAQVFWPTTDVSSTVKASSLHGTHGWILPAHCRSAIPRRTVAITAGGGRPRSLSDA